MSENETIKLSGWVNLKQIRNGVMLNEVETPNTVVNTGKAQLAGLINGIVTEFFDYIAIGTGTTAAATTQTALVAEATRGSATCSRVTTTATNDTAQLVSTFAFNAATAITEAGVFDINAAGSMLCRQTFSALNMGSGDSLQTTWKVQAS